MAALLKSSFNFTPSLKFNHSTLKTLPPIRNFIKIKIDVKNNNISLLSIQDSKFKNTYSKSSPDEKPVRESRSGDNFPPPNGGGGGGGGGGGDGGEDDYEKKKFGIVQKFILTRCLMGSGSALRNEFKLVLKTLCRAMFAALVWMLLLRMGKPSVASGGFKKSVVLPTSFLKFDKRGCTFSTLLLHATLLYKGSRWALGFLITSCAMLLDKMLPGFLFEAGIEIVIDSCCATFAEIHKRGKDLWDEFKSYVADLLAGMLAPYAGTGNQSLASVLNNSSLDKDIAPPVMAIRQGQIQEKSQAAEWKRKGEGKLVNAPNKKKNETPPPAKKEHPAKDQACHHCGVIGHWKRNCLAYLAELKKGKSGSSNPGT